MNKNLLKILLKLKNKVFPALYTQLAVNCTLRKAYKINLKNDKGTKELKN